MAATIYMARDGYFITYSIGTDLTEWDNAQAALIVGEINCIDWFISAIITHTKPKTININPMTSAHVAKRLTTGRTLGKINSTHFLQTGIFTYAVMGASTAVAGGVERDITKDTDELPIWLGFHLEKEGTTANRRKDVMGVVPNNLNISVSEVAPIARQTYTGQFTYTGAGGNLAQPSALVQATYLPYTWYNYKSASGASSLLYNAGAVNINIVGLEINFGWSGTTFGTYDANGYPNTGLYNPPFTVRVTIDCKYKDAAGTDIQTISDLKHDAYAGDLDLIVDFYQSATRYLKYTFDDMFVDPESFEEVFQSEGDWFDGFRFDLVFRNETSSLAVKTMDGLADTYYTNP
jgi:hypothetical protein